MFLKEANTRSGTEAVWPAEVATRALNSFIDRSPISDDKVPSEYESYQSVGDNQGKSILTESWVDEEMIVELGTPVKKLGICEGVIEGSAL